MGRVYLVRHGQAAFGTEDYDRLTEAGVAQCRQLARHWRAIGRDVDFVYAGSLRRHRESADAFVQASVEEGARPLPVRLLPGVEEYDYSGLLAALPGNDLYPDPGADRRAFYRRLSEALRAWAAGELQGVEPYASFRDRCTTALATLLRDIGSSRNAVLFGSAGSLAAAMQPTLRLADQDLLRVKLTFYNSGVSSLLFDGEAIRIETLNTVSHLELPAFRHLITYS